MTLALYSFWMSLIFTFKFSVQVGKAPRCALQRSGKQCVCRRALKQTPEWTCKLAVGAESFPENIKQQINERASVRNVDHSKWNTFRYGTLRRVSVSRSITCVRLLLRLTAHCNNSVYSFPASLFWSGVPELMSHARPSPGLYSSACSALPGTLNTSPWSCFLVHGLSLRTYCKWFTPVLGPRPAPERGRRDRRCEKAVKIRGCRAASLWLSWKRLINFKNIYSRYCSIVLTACLPSLPTKLELQF